jgi:hypothetical protein
MRYVSPLLSLETTALETCLQSTNSKTFSEEVIANCPLTDSRLWSLEVWFEKSQIVILITVQSGTISVRHVTFDISIPI